MYNPADYAGPDLTSKTGGLSALARLYFDIAIWRRGPQDVPAVGILLPFTIAVYFLLNAALAGLGIEPARAWLEQLVVDVGFTALWYWALLALTRRRARYAQTVCAIFGYQAVLTPLSGLADFLVQRFGSDTVLQVPVYGVFFGLLLWTVIATAHILRAALERPLSLCLALSFAQLLAEELLYYVLFGPGV
ncbi:MAG: hypothetical protein ACHQAR_00345 [Steroidobacterales bacterium]